MSILEALNAWIANNQALVVSVGLPLFTLAITGWASFLSHRAKVSEVRLNGHVKLSEYRKANFDELLRLSARLQAQFMEAASETLVESHEVKKSKTEQLLDVIESTNLFLLRSDADKEQVQQFTDCIEICTRSLISREMDVDIAENTLGRLRVVCKGILDKEWARIEGELKGRAP